MTLFVTKYMPDAEFVAFVKSVPQEKKKLSGVGGFNRWIIKDEDGSEYILRPESSRKDI